jgi:hypothetical protein
MEKLKKYQKIILKTLEDYAAIKSPFMPEVENIVIVDTKHHHYQLLRLGWYQGSHVHYAVFHFDISDGKVWIQENRTDVDIKQELIEARILEEDIISGLQYPTLKASA